MKKYVSSIIITLILIFFSFDVIAKDQSDYGKYLQISQSKEMRPQIQVLSITHVRGSEMIKFINKQVTLEGYYYDGSIPMILDDIQRVYVDTPLPRESYIPIVGPKPHGLKWGDKVSITGVLLKPTLQDDPLIQKEPVIIKIEKIEHFRILKPASSMERTLSPLKITQSAKESSNLYAVLIVGGGDPANNHIRYWNDLKTMYSILRSNGYPASNIYVIYADGKGRDNSIPVNYPATTINIAKVFDALSKKMTEKDILFIMLNDHGGPNSLILWYSQMTNTAFANEVSKINNYKHIIILMKQCFSGSFIAPLTGLSRTVMSSCAPHELSYSHSSMNFGEFTYWFFAALTGQKPDGSGTVNADSNRDGKVSLLEAFNFARYNDKAPETPHFEDDGLIPARTGHIPSGTDGYYSSIVYINRIEEDCIEFNPNRAEIQNIRGRWKIVDGNHWLFDFENKKTEAEKALDIIKNYKMNQVCYIGRPEASFTYLLSSGIAPIGFLRGEDCVSFNPGNLEVKKIEGRWKIVDGNHWLFDFGSKESEAKLSFSIIKKYRFSKSCFVGRPKPSFTYLKK